MWQISHHRLDVCKGRGRRCGGHGHQVGWLWRCQWWPRGGARVPRSSVAEVMVVDVAVGGGSRALFVWLISYDRKYCWLICCEEMWEKNTVESLTDLADKLKRTRQRSFVAEVAPLEAAGWGISSRLGCASRWQWEIPRPHEYRRGIFFSRLYSPPGISPRQ